MSLRKDSLKIVGEGVLLTIIFSVFGTCILILRPFAVTLHNQKGKASVTSLLGDFKAAVKTKVQRVQ